MDEPKTAKMYKTTIVMISMLILYCNLIRKIVVETSNIHQILIRKNARCDEIFKPY